MLMPLSSFGFGGTNAHAILESYQQAQIVSKTSQQDTNNITILPFVFSAASEGSLMKYLTLFKSWLQHSGPTIHVRDLAYTLHARRTQHTISVAFACQSVEDLCDQIEKTLEKARVENGAIGVRLLKFISPTPRAPKVLGIFTGQGAGWPGMGATLVRNSTRLQQTVQRLEYRLSKLAAPDQPSWSLAEELQRLDSPHINNAAFSQPLCTALQILQVDLIRSAGIEFAAVIGHSSGEIAAAYAAGMISAEEAVLVAHQRGLKCRLAKSTDDKDGSMMAVGASFDDVQALCDEPELTGRVCVAAVNSPASVTVSGDSDGIDEMEIILQDEKKFVRILRVDKAYHSHHMIPCSQPYRDSLEALEINAQEGSGCSWYSSVFERRRMNDCVESLRGEYWELNLTRPVLFMQAVQHTYKTEGPFDLTIEVGPHPALKGPTLQTINEFCVDEPLYCGVSHRGEDAIQSFAKALGFMRTHFGASFVDFRAYEQYCNETQGATLLKGLPNYAWDHETEYWHESRLVRAIRTRADAPHELLGHLQPDSTDQEVRWRNMLRPQEIKWLADHRLQGQIVFPAAGYIVAAMEASISLSRALPVKLVEILDLDIVKALTFDDEDSSVEALFSISDINLNSHSLTAHFKYHAAKWDHDGPLHLLAVGRLQIHLGRADHDVLPVRPSSPPNLVSIPPQDFYAAIRKNEYEYHGPFAALRKIERKYGAAIGEISTAKGTEMLIHPATLDAAFQSVLVAHSAPGDGRLWSMHVPKSIRSVRVNPDLCLHSKEHDSMIFFDSVQTPDSIDLEGDVQLYSTKVENAMIQVEGLLCVPFSRATDQADTVLFSETVYGTMSPDANIVAYDGHPTAQQIDLVGILERVAAFYLRVLHSGVPMDHPSRTTGPLTAYYRLAAHVTSLDRTTGSRFWKPEWQTDTPQMIANLCEPYVNVIDVKLLRAVGENIIDIAKGHKQAIEIGMDGDMLAQYYQHAVGMSAYTRYLARTVKQIVHKHPHMDILEIGAGTGGATRGIFSEIGQCFASYTFTDISSGFFGTAKSTFSEYSPKMKFRVLDISRDPYEQDFSAEQSYDLIVASMVLHATPLLGQTLQHVRKLLKPGGHLVVLEGYNNDAFRVGTIFGSFPGWWLGDEDGRKLSPCVDPSRWDQLLREAGFSGCDTMTPDPDPLTMPLTLFVAQGLDDKVKFLREPLSLQARQCWQSMRGVADQRVVLLGGGTVRTCKLLNHLKPLLSSIFGEVEIFRSITEASISLGPSTTILSMLDLDLPIFSNMVENEWECLKKILTQTNVILWVTHGQLSYNPYDRMMKGILRCSARESPLQKSQVLEVNDLEALDARMLAEYLLRLQASSIWEQHDTWRSFNGTIEQEILLISENKALVPRVIPSPQMNARYNSSRRLVKCAQNLESSENLRLDFTSSTLLLRNEYGHRGAGAYICVGQSLLTAVKVSTSAYLYLVMGQNSENDETTIALSLINAHFVGAWNNASCTVAHGEDNKAKFMEQVAQHLIIIEILQGLGRGDILLVHEPDAHFAAALLLQANALNVDVVFTTESSAMAVQNGWNHIPAWCLERTLRRLLPENTSVFVDWSGKENPGLSGHRIRNQLHRPCRFEDHETLFCMRSVPPADSHIEKVSKRLQTAVDFAKKSLRSMTDQTMKGLEFSTIEISKLPDPCVERLNPLTIVFWDPLSRVQVTQQPVDSRPLFRESGTYWLVGLNGGLGLSLCEWMIRHGARNVVISSRRPEVDERWLSQFALADACVKVIACDVTKEEDLANVYASICESSPKIIGVAQGAMVLEDISIGDMPFDCLSRVVAPKVTGSLHLSNLFQKDTLDFFVFFSSVSSVVGNPGQANYSAANLFMGGLADQRRQRGLAASIINIGPVVGVGYITQENIQAKTLGSKSKGYMGISERDFHQLFAEAVISSRPDSGLPSEITTGLKPIQSACDTETAPGWAKNPMFGHLVINSPSSYTEASAGSRIAVPVKSQLGKAASRSDIYDIVKNAFLPKLSASFQLDAEGLLKEDLNLFRLDEAGVDSLLAVEIRTWFMKTLDVNIPVLRILNATIGELLDFACDTLTPSLNDSVVDDAGTLETSVVSTTGTVRTVVSETSSLSRSEIPETPVLEHIEKLSFSQSMFWFVQTAFDDQTTLNHSGTFKLSGGLQPQQLSNAVLMIGRQHEALRTCYFDDRGEGKQGIMHSSCLHLEHYQISNEGEVDRMRVALQNHIFDIRRGETIRILLLSLSETVHYLVIGANGLVMDGLSFQVFLNDLQQHYLSAGPSADATRQFRIFSKAQHDNYAANRYDTSLKFWRSIYPEFLPPTPILRVSKVSSRPTLTSYDNERVDVRIDSTTRAQIHAVCRQHRVTAFHFLLSVFRAFIARHGGLDAEDVSIGVGDANRTEYDMHGSTGMFLNILPLRFRTQSSESFAEVLTDTRVKMYEALAHSDVPFQIIIDELEAPRTAESTPIFQYFIDYRQGQREKMPWADCQLEMLAFQASKTPYDISLDIIDSSDGETLLMFQVRKDLYDRTAAQLLASSYKHLVEVFASDQCKKLSQPGLFPPRDTQKMQQLCKGESILSH